MFTSSSTILVVDDEPGILDAYRTYLAPRVEAPVIRSSRRAAPVQEPRAGETYRLLFADSGDRAVSVVREELAHGRRIAAAFFDMKMPGGMDGLEAIRQVRGLDNEILCAVVTAYQDRAIEDINAHFAGGHEDEWDFINKPFTENEIRQKARNLVTSWNRRRREEQERRDLERLIRHLSEIRELARDHLMGIMQHALRQLVDFTGSEGGLVVQLGDGLEFQTGCGTLETPAQAQPVLARPDLIERVTRPGSLSEPVSLEGLLVVHFLCTRAPRGAVVLQARHVGEQKRALVRIFAESTSAALDNCQLFAELRSLNDALERRVDERTRLLSDTNVVLEEKTRELERMLVSLRDTEQQLAHKERLAAVGQLAAGVAHEINNPAAYVLVNLAEVGRASENVAACVRMIEGGTPPAELARWTRESGLTQQSGELQAMVAESIDGMQRIVNLVRELRVFARSDKEGPVSLSMDAIIERAVRMVANAARHRGVDLQVSCEPGIEVSGREARMTQVFVNLFGNALDAFEGTTRDGKTLRVQAARVGECVVVTVADNGCGIPAERLERVFEPFFTTKPAGKGTGLGLSITKAIVVEHDGAIGVESRPGEGTVFTLRFPLALAQPAQANATEADDTAAPSPDVRLLLVEDDERVCKANARLLSQHYQVETVASGRAALELLARDREFDVILCDVMMPEMSGAQVYDFLREHGPVLARRFVFVSGGAFGPDTLELLSGVSLLAKPVDLAAVHEAVRRVMAQAPRAARAPAG